MKQQVVISSQLHSVFTQVSKIYERKSADTATKLHSDLHPRVSCCQSKLNNAMYRFFSAREAQSSHLGSQSQFPRILEYLYLVLFMPILIKYLFQDSGLFFVNEYLLCSLCSWYNYFPHSIKCYIVGQEHNSGDHAIVKQQ